MSDKQFFKYNCLRIECQILKVNLKSFKRANSPKDAFNVFNYVYIHHSEFCKIIKSITEKKDFVKAN